MIDSDTPISLRDLDATLRRRASRATSSVFKTQPGVLGRALQSQLERSGPESDGLIGGPVFEATFPWKTARKRLGDLSENLLEPRLVEALDQPPNDLAEHRFPLDRRPYLHQLEAWQALTSDKHQSAVISSGTGSGKTECFFIPVLNDLVGQLRNDQALFGVQALFLYPLNALINSQRDRLRAWTGRFGSELRFCLYNGETRRSVPSHQQYKNPSQILGRRLLRREPPPILVTNATMLEYMLVRQEDQPILEKSKGKLRWIILDEAHTYLGSQAAEIALLMRRVMTSFGVDPAEVKIVATSATIGKNSTRDKELLAQFIGDLSGTSPERVAVITGQRDIPPLPDFGNPDEEAASISSLRKLSLSQRYRALSLDPRALQLRESLAEREGTTEDLLELLNVADSNQRLARQDLLDLFDLTSSSFPPDGIGSDIPFLPVRAHFFHRTLVGVWACTNPICTGRKATDLEHENWPFGGIFFERRERCPECQSVVMELATCAACGGVHLRCEEQIEPGVRFLAASEVAFDDEDGDEELIPLDGEEDSDRPTEEAGDKASFQRLAVAPGRAIAGSWEVCIDAQTGQFDPGDSRRSLRLTLVGPEEDGVFRCTRCHERESMYRGRLFRPLRLGSNFYLGVSIPALLEHTPPIADRPKDHPFGGRRLLTFSDSRQGTARFTLRAQLEAERTHVRSLIVHTLAGRRQQSTPDSSEIESLRSQINALESALESNPSLRPVLETMKAKLTSDTEPPIGTVTWEEAIEALLGSESVRTWISDAWRELSWNELQDRELAEYLLLREFFRRPRRSSSLETLGLVCLNYPNLRRPSQLPLAWSAANYSEDDWTVLQNIFLNFLVRARSAVVTPEKFLAWMDTPIRESYLVGPETAELAKNQVRWPSSGSPGFKRSRVVRYLAELLSLDTDDRSHREQLDSILTRLWDTLQPVLTQRPDGYQLDLREQVVVSEPTEIYLCPITRQGLTRSVAQITPYLPTDLNRFMRPELTQVTAIEPVKIPQAHWRDPRGRDWSRAEILAWLETDEAVQNQRQHGLWTETTDRIVAHASYFRVAEHSAQQDSSLLRRYEQKFKKGDINILSCSTTMEMGVDIGGLSAVVMNNAPPGPANFLQRAGRAGRRGEGVAVSMTLCSGSPHSEAVFRRPDWPFRTPIYVPKVSLQSERIVRRHMQAFLLSQFFTHSRLDDPTRLVAGWFFEREEDNETSPEEQFREWLGSKRNANRNSVKTGLRRLLAGTILSGVQPPDLLEQVAAEIATITSRWKTEVEALERQLSDLEPKKNERGPAHLALERQMARLRGEYLLGELSSQGFLPGYGFPTSLVPFISTTYAQIRREKPWTNSGRDDVPSRRRGYPSRELSMAIREYAPGNEIVLDNRVYTSRGVTLNWHIPAGDNDVRRELQAFRKAWKCKRCGSTGSSSRNPDRCPNCGHTNDRFLSIHGYLQPAGFAVDFFHPPKLHHDPSLYVPVEDPWITAGDAPWLTLPDSQFGRYRTSRHGHVFHHSRGLHQNGFAVCLRCGRADSELHGPGGDLPASMVDHRRLRGGRNEEGELEALCPGNRQPFAMRRNEWFGIASYTDVFELQLRNPQNLGPTSRAGAFSVAAALRDSLAERLGIDSKELGCSVVPSRMASGESGWSAVVFDHASGGAGFSSEAAELLPWLLESAAQRLDCPRDCEACCQSCLLSYDTQHDIKHLDRHEGLELLADSLLESMSLGSESRLFGPKSALELIELTEALRREAQSQPFEILRIFLGGQSEEWDFDAWPVVRSIHRWISEGRRVNLFLADQTKESLPPAFATSLANLGNQVGIKLLESSPEHWREGSGYRIVEMIGLARSTVWGVTSRQSLIPSQEWGSGENSSLIRARQNESLPEPEALPIDPESLRPSAPSGSMEVRILGELDGPVVSFGSRFWTLMLESSPTLRGWAAQGKRLQRINYQDRFLHSPLVIRLFRDCINQLVSLDLVGPRTELDILTSTPRGYRFAPSAYHESWVHSEEIEAILEATIGELFGDGYRFRTLPRKETPHHRRLELIADAETSWTCILDQGFGYWRTRGRISFPFAQSASDQAKQLSRARFHIKGRSERYSTYLFITQ